MFGFSYVRGRGPGGITPIWVHRLQLVLMRSQTPGHRQGRVRPDQRKRRSDTRVSTPRQAIVGDHEAWFWDVVHDGFHYELAWWPFDGHLRYSYPSTDTKRSQFLRMGPRYSPRHSLSDAIASVRDWVISLEAR